MRSNNEPAIHPSNNKCARYSTVIYWEEDFRTFLFELRGGDYCVCRTEIRPTIAVVPGDFVLQDRKPLNPLDF